MAEAILSCPEPRFRRRRRDPSCTAREAFPLDGGTATVWITRGLCGELLPWPDQAVMPPSTGSQTPVMYEASLETRKVTALAISSG